MNRARSILFEYIYEFYNAIRRHPANGGLSPEEFERRWYGGQVGVQQFGTRSFTPISGRMRQTQTRPANVGQTPAAILGARDRGRAHIGQDTIDEAFSEGAMKSASLTVDDYVNGLPEERKGAIQRLQKVIRENLPNGFSEEMNYGMIGYVVPLSLYPEGYLGKRDQPLPFMNLASQKNYIAVYHMGMYSNQALRHWFKERYESEYPTKLDMGKICLRFSRIDHIPFKLIGELSAKTSVDEWIAQYEEARSTK